MQFQIQRFQTLESTSLKAREKVLCGASEGTIILADEQTEGYGRRGNAWISFQGNLMFTLILHPHRALVEVPQLSFITALAVGEALEPFLDPGVHLTYKWPNDIMLDDEKMGGILLETETLLGNTFPHVLLGIGINLLKAPLLGRPTTALVKKARVLPERDDLLTTILHHFGEMYERWLSEGFVWAQKEWQEKAFCRGKPIEFLSPQGSISGQFLGIDSKGGLVLQVDEKTEKIFYSGQILF